MDDLNDKSDSPSKTRELASPRTETWFDRNANEIASFFAVLFALSLGCFAFALCTDLLSLFTINQESTEKSAYFDLLNSRNFAFLTGSLAVAVYAFYLVVVFSRKVVERSNENKENEADIAYVVSRSSIETLRAAGVPDDVTKCLTRMLRGNRRATNQPVALIIREPPQSSPQGLLARLKEDLGETRVAEFSDVILRYTRRTVSPVKQPSK